MWLLFTHSQKRTQYLPNKLMDLSFRAGWLGLAGGQNPTKKEIVFKTKYKDDQNWGIFEFFLSNALPGWLGSAGGQNPTQRNFFQHYRDDQNGLIHIETEDFNFSLLGGQDRNPGS